eukprot:1156442-Pelagomonas_calceolata.AAC.2
MEGADEEKERECMCVCHTDGQGNHARQGLRTEQKHVGRRGVTYSPQIPCVSTLIKTSSNKNNYPSYTVLNIALQNAGT